VAPYQDPVHHPNGHGKSRKTPSQYQPSISSVDVSKEDNYLKILARLDVFAKSLYFPLFALPAQAGIQGF